MSSTTPGEISELLNRDPLKLKLLDNKLYHQDRGLSVVSSPNIFEPNSTRFHPQGLFSEEIFGPITDMRRFTTEAVIQLNTRVIHPAIFALLFEKKSLYIGVMSGKKYAVWDDESGSLQLSGPDVKGAGTGYSWFIEQLPKLSSVDGSEALRAHNLQTVLKKYRKNLLIEHLVVLPAGLRDLDRSTSRLSKDDVNKLYLATLNLAGGLSDYELSEDPIFDGIRYQLQLKVVEIFHYFKGVMEDKKGFMQKHYGARKITYSTRNVISVPISSGDKAGDVRNIKADETMIPMLNLVKCLHPFFINYVRRKLYGEIFTHGTMENIPVTDPKTLSLTYVSLKTVEANKYLTSKGAGRLLNQFKYIGFRESPVSVKAIDRKDYWLLLVYRTEDKVFVGKTADDLKVAVEFHGMNWDRASVDALRWAEALYIASLYIVPGKHVLFTRYPVTGEASIYPSKIHPITTDPSREVEVIIDGSVRIAAPHYPVIGGSYHESAIVHQSRLSGLGADFDGDMGSITAVWGDEGNREIAEAMQRPSSVVGADMKLQLRADRDIVEMLVHNLSK